MGDTTVKSFTRMLNEFISSEKWGDGAIRGDGEPAPKSAEPLREDPQRGTGAPGPWHQIGRDDQPDPNTLDVGDGDCVADDICSTWYTFGHRGGTFTLKPGDLDPCPPETSITYTMDDDTGEPLQPGGVYNVVGYMVSAASRARILGSEPGLVDGDGAAATHLLAARSSDDLSHMADAASYPPWAQSGEMIISVAPSPLEDNPRAQTKRIAEKLEALEREAAMRESCPPRKVFLCDHCDRHHEGRLQSVNVKLGAQYAVTCEATGLESVRWIPAAELWG